MGKRTKLYDKHVAMGAKIVDFSGWDMPIHYGSQIEEHHQVRRDAGMFDVSHMTIVDLTGERVREFLRYLLANNVDRLQTSGKALYSCMLNDQGGVIDDLIVYYINETWFRMVVNAATRDKDLAWIERQAQNFGVKVTERPELAMIAVQGPNAREKVHKVLDERATEASSLKPFHSCVLNDLFIARTGYTGEDGYEVILPEDEAPDFWEYLAKLGVKPIGLGARDTLRLEAGMNLYGTDMTEQTNPLESGLSWTVAWEPEDRDFIGRSAIEPFRSQPPERLVGLVLEGKGVLRHGQEVYIGENKVGEITSGSYSPTLEKSIAFARLADQNSTSCFVDIRGKMIPASIVKPPFVRNGKSCL
jgi:aminomethyltransferase